MRATRPVATFGPARWAGHGQAVERSEVVRGRLRLPVRWRHPRSARDRHADLVQLPPSEIIGREVYTKAAKGDVAVRKLGVWQTHEHEVGRELGYPALVVQFTDFSAGRTDAGYVTDHPLPTQVSTSSSETKASSQSSTSPTPSAIA